MARVIAACVALAAFAVAILAGLAGGSPSLTVLSRAVVAMMLCYPVGLIIGMVCDHVIRLHLQDYQKQKPIPDSGENAGIPNGRAEQEQEEILTV